MLRFFATNCFCINLRVKSSKIELIKRPFYELILSRCKRIWSQKQGNLYRIWKPSVSECQPFIEAYDYVQVVIKCQRECWCAHWINGKQAMTVYLSFMLCQLEA